MYECMPHEMMRIVRHAGCSLSLEPGRKSIPCIHRHALAHDVESCSTMPATASCCTSFQSLLHMFMPTKQFIHFHGNARDADNLIACRFADSLYYTEDTLWKQAVGLKRGV